MARINEGDIAKITNTSPLGHGLSVAILGSVGSASGGDIQVVLQREFQSGDMWFSVGELIPNVRHIGGVSRVLLRDIGLPFWSEDLQLVRDEVVSITRSDGTKHHVSNFAASAPSSFSTSHLRTVGPQL
jgi:hypothetical protein